MDKMTSGEGHLFDPKSKTWYYYYSFTNPDWFVIYRVSDTTLTVITRHETTVVGWGFALAGEMLHRRRSAAWYVQLLPCAMSRVPC